MERYKYVILGAGPTGLTVANRLMDLQEDSVLILEKEEEAGGLCRSIQVDDAPLDVGGGHFLDTRSSEVTSYLFRFMEKDEWNIYERDSKIQLERGVVDHPIEANIWQLDIDSQVEYLMSIAKAGCNRNMPKPEEFVPWIYWKLGDKIADDYMIPYNQKMFGEDLNHLGTYWLNKLPSVSFEETLLSCLTRKSHGKQPGHATFFYPKKYGYGEVWKRMARRLGTHIKYNSTVSSVNIKSREIQTAFGDRIEADRIITTIPWREVRWEEIPEELNEKIEKLKYTSVDICYYNDDLDTKAQWIYIPNLNINYHRVLVRKNFCTNAKGYWTETNVKHLDFAAMEGCFHYVNEYAYPLNTIEKPYIMDELLKWFSQREIWGIGRWGEWQHYNSDITVERALRFVETLL